MAVSTVKAHPAPRRTRSLRRASDAFTFTLMKNQLHPPLPPSAHSHIKAAPLHDAVAAHAQALWRRHGHPANRHEAIWLEAALFLLTLTPVLPRLP